MKILDFLVLLRERDVRLWVDGERLRCSAPPGALTIELQRAIRERKDEIVKFLRLADSLDQPQRALVPLQPQGNAIPIFAVAGHNGDVFCFRALARHLGNDQPFFGLQPPGLDGVEAPLTRVEDLAACFAAQIRTARPEGGCVIAGYCAGGTIAFELARQLVQSGAHVSFLALFGSPFPTSYRFWPRLRQGLGEAAERVTRHARKLMSLSAAERKKYFAERLRNFQAERATRRAAVQDPVFVWRDQVGCATLAAIRHYVPGNFSGRVRLFWPGKECNHTALLQWPAVAPDIETYFGPAGCNGTVMLNETYAAAFAELFRRSVPGAPDRSIVQPQQSEIPSPRWESGAMKPLPS
ncbi:MAG TPA: thioesterase domain-containing protein [Verrucomicrobiae bacterium]|nr:thioesterase domain-containing protein [Verrucomicrobiae bacterium]